MEVPVDIRSSLDRWAEAGLITPEQVTAIASFEGEDATPQGTSRGIEAVAYLGATLVLVALFLLGQELWDRVEAWGQLSLALVVTAVLFATGYFLGRSEEVAVRRAQTFAWFLTVAGIALSGGVLVFEVLDLREQDAGIWVALIALAGALALWMRRQSSLQMVAVAASAFATTITLLTRFDNLPDWAFGLSFTGLGIIWLLLTWGGVFVPVRTSYVLGAVGVLFIAFPESSDMPWPLLGLLAALGLVGLSVRLGQQVLMGVGIAGLFVYVPMTVFEWFGDSLGAIAALLITGVVLLGAVVGVVQLRRST